MEMVDFLPNLEDLLKLKFLNKWLSGKVSKFIVAEIQEVALHIVQLL
jgi:hypothetical protein